MLNLLTFQISGFSVSTWACGRDRHHDTSGWYTQNGVVTATSQSTGIAGRIRRAYSMWPRRRSHVSAGTDKELCEGDVLLQVERDSEPRGDPQVRRQVIEELL